MHGVCFLSWFLAPIVKASLTQLLFVLFVFSPLFLVFLVKSRKGIFNISNNEIKELRFHWSKTQVIVE